MSSPTSPRRLQATERAIKALNLRRQGWSFRDIAQELGVTPPAVHEAVTRMLRNMTHEEADSYRKIELERMETMLKAIWGRVTEGELQAIDRAIRISERISRLLGLDAPVKLDVPGGLTLAQLIIQAGQPEKIIDAQGTVKDAPSRIDANGKDVSNLEPDEQEPSNGKST